MDAFDVLGLITCFLMVGISIFFGTTRNARLKSLVFKWAGILWILTLAAYFTIVGSIIFGLIVVVLGIPAFLLRKWTLVFCNSCGRNLFNRFGDPICPYCKSRELY